MGFPQRSGYDVGSAFKSIRKIFELVSELDTRKLVSWMKFFF